MLVCLSKAWSNLYIISKLLSYEDKKKEENLVEMKQLLEGDL